MRRGLAFLGGLAVGAGLMYALDPRLGRHRRALLGQKASRWANVANAALEDFSRDLGNRAYGCVARSLNSLADEPVSDPRLAARVRARLGHVIARPHDVTVDAVGGTVRLGGDVPEAELAALLACVWRVPGVRAIDNRLTTHPAEARVGG